MLNRPVLKLRDVVYFDSDNHPLYYSTDDVLLGEHDIIMCERILSEELDKLKLI